MTRMGHSHQEVTSGIFSKLFLAAYMLGCCARDLHRCDLPLGLGDGRILNSAISSSVGSNAVKARVDGDGAWCFKSSEVTLNQKATFTVDLGRKVFASGLQLQGPPPGIKEGNMYHIGYYVHYSNNESDVAWNTCCLEAASMFFADVKPGSSDVKRTSPFKTFLLARKLRLSFVTSLGWAGNDEKCFRFEVLGCDLDVVPLTNIFQRTILDGTIEIMWSKPTIIGPSQNSSIVHELNATTYEVNYTWSDAMFTSTPMHRYARERFFKVPRAVWGANYTFDLTCPFQGVKVSCGNSSLLAVVAECGSSDGSCNSENKPIFRRPEKLNACAIGTDRGPNITNVTFIWVFESPGWETRQKKFIFRDAISGLTKEEKITNETTLTFHDVNIGGNWSAFYIPQGVDQKITPNFQYRIFIVPWLQVLPESEMPSESSSRYGAFSADVDLKLSIHWEAHIIGHWRPAVMRGGAKECGINPTANNASGNITEDSWFTLEANEYTAIVRDNDSGQLLEVLNTSSTAFKTKNRFLQFKKTYRVTLICYFGSLEFECASTTIFTEMPSKISSINGTLIVLTYLKGGDQWHRQQDTCSRGEGNLTTFETEEKEAHLMTHISGIKSLYSFWFGLNFCPNNQGHPWIDKSTFDYSKLAEKYTDLTVETCCIKSVRSDDDKFWWHGESCSSLLRAICQFKPRDLLGRISSLEKLSADQHSVVIRWKYEEDYWTPDAFTISACASTHLRTFQKIPEKERACQFIRVDINSTTYTLDNLLSYTEYEINVTASILLLEYHSQPASISIRTCADDVFLYSVTEAGFLEAVWAEKVCKFEDNDVIDVTVNSTTSNHEIYRESIPAKNFSVGGLKLGDELILTAKETDGQKKKIVRTTRAYPPCRKCLDCRQAESCIFISASKSTNKNMNDECRDKKGVPVTSVTQERLKFLLALADKFKDNLWVGEDSMNEKDDDKSSERDFGPRVIQLDGKPSNRCMVVSRSARKITKAYCEERHFVACGQSVSVESVFPQDMQTKIGGDWLLFTWNQTTGWLYDGRAKHSKKSNRRTKRDDATQSFQKPPVLLSNLEVGTEYSVEFYGDLGKGIISKSGSFDRITASDLSSGPPDTSSLVETTVTKDLGISAGWAPSSKHYLAHLVSGTLLIAACISTMLMFFATGMFYQDCIAQLGFLFSLMAGYLILLTSHPQYYNGDKGGCLAVAIFLHACFFCAFFFITLESFVLASLLVKKIENPFERSNWLLIGAGLGVPIIYVAIIGGSLNYAYMDPYIHNCWLNTKTGAFYAVTIPHVILVLGSILLGISSLHTSIENQPELKDSEIRGRQSDSYKLRWVIIVVTLELAGAWSSGIAAFSQQTSTPHILFDVFTILLILTIFLGRLWFDETFRSKLNRLCCGTELTYKRSKLMTISARTRVNPVALRNERSQEGQRASVSATTATSRQQSALPSYALPNSPANDNNTVSTVLIKRSYQFNDGL